MAEGWVQVAANIKKGAAKGTVDGLNAWLDTVLETAKQLAPIGPPVLYSRAHVIRAFINMERHPGHLRDSGKITKRPDREKLVNHVPTMGEIVFDAVYAARQHEELSWKHPQGGQAKYLETAIKMHLPELEAMVGIGIKRVFVLGEK